MPDPVWALSGEQASEALKLIKDVDTKKAIVTGGLGYRGFSLMDTEADEKTTPYLFDSEASDSQGGSFLSGNPEIEEFLLWTGQEQFDDEVANHVHMTILEGPPEAPDAKSLAAVSCPPCGGGTAPAYNPGYWNNDATRRKRNNCYNYTNNKATNTFAQPGRGSGKVLSSLSCGGSGGVQPAATRDGLRSVPTFKASIPKGWYTALVIWPGVDYHWYRQDTNGCWSHKPGQTPVRDVDNSGNKITDPRHANRGQYTIFCSYMVTNSGVRIA